MRLTAAGVTFSSAAAEAKLPAISGYYVLQGSCMLLASEPWRAM